MPAQWAIITENLAGAFRSLSEIDGDGARLDQAIGLMDRAILVFEGMQAGYYVEKAQRNLAVLIALRDRLGGAD